jgi:hypothetical protein
MAGLTAAGSAFRMSVQSNDSSEAVCGAVPQTIGINFEMICHCALRRNRKRVSTFYGGDIGATVANIGRHIAPGLY